MNSINIPNNIPLPPTIGSATPLGAGTGAPATEGASFKDFLLNSIQQVNSMQQEADKAVEDMFTGGDTDPATVLTAVQKADMAFRMMMQIRNKLSSAYDEFKNIRI
jgi:flagellar hook-basal body complex protein FliE